MISNGYVIIVIKNSIEVKIETEIKDTETYKLDPGVYLKKTKPFNEWTIIYPIKDPETGKFNKRNFLMGGSWVNFLEICAVLIILLFIVWAYKHDTAVCQDIFKNPCKYCINGHFNPLTGKWDILNETSWNWSNISHNYTQIKNKT